MGDDYYDMLSSVEDLVGRMIVASERKVSQSTEPDLALLALGFPLPSETTNDQLSILQPFYIKLLQNIENSSSHLLKKGRDPITNENENENENESILDRLEKSEDDAMFLLYVLEFPLLVLTARKDTYGIAKCSIEESYEISSITRRIIRNKTLLVWCRNVITNQQNCNCISIITSAVSFLSAIDPDNGLLSRSKAKKVIRKQIFEGKDDETGFNTLRSNLANVVSRDDITHTLVANSILMQIHILRNIYGEDHILTQLERASSKDSFTNALFQVQDRLDENLFRQFLMMVDSSKFYSLYQNDSLRVPCPANKRGGIQSVFVCDRDGCTNPGHERCSRCKFVAYCSKECQVASWPVHKRNCKPKKVRTKKVDAAAKVARQALNPVLVRQNQLLKKNPNVDYVIVSSGNRDTGVQIVDPMGKLMFRYFRNLAPNTPGAVFRLYQWLAETHPNLASVIRNQLTAEYGVDPLSDSAKNGRIPEMKEEDISNML